MHEGYQMPNFVEHREGVYVAIQSNEYGRPASIDIDGMRVAIKTDFTAHYGMTREAIVAHIMSNVIQCFPGISKKELIGSMLGVFDKIVWADKHSFKNDTEGLFWMQNASRQLGRKAERTNGEYVRDIHGEKRDRARIKREQEEEMKRQMLLSEEELLREKYRYVEDAKDMTFDGLQELDKYIKDQRENLQLDEQRV